MEVERQGRVVGEFLGNQPGRVYELSDGSRWRQEGSTEEPVCRQNPASRLLYNRSTNLQYLDIEGSSGIVQVVPDRGMGGMGAGAY